MTDIQTVYMYFTLYYSINEILCFINTYSFYFRPEDTEERRAVLILRHVPEDAPRMTIEDLAELRRTEDLKKTKQGPGWRGRSRSPPRWKHPPPRSLRRRTSRSRSSDRKQTGDVVRRRSNSRGRRIRRDSRMVSRSMSPNLTGTRRNEEDERRRTLSTKEGRGEKRRKEADDSSPSPESKRYRRIVQISGSVNEETRINKKDEEDSKNAKSEFKSKIGFQDRIVRGKDKLEEGELSSGSDSSPERNFPKKQSKKKSSSKLRKVLGSDSEMDLEKEIENLERRSKNSLRTEVGELRNELNDLKGLVRNLSKDKENGSKTINALDIIAREVRTKIMKNEETTTETILKLKVEKKKKLLRAKLDKLKKDDEMDGKENKGGKEKQRDRKDSRS